MNAIAAKLLENGIPHLLVSFSGPFLSFMTGYYFMCKLLPNRLNRYSLSVLSIVYALWYHLRVPDLLGTRYHLWMTIFVNALTFCVLIFFFQGKLWRKLIVWWYFDVIKTMCEAVSYVPILLYYARSGFRGEWAVIVSSVESSMALKLVYIATFLSIFLLLGFLSLKVWRKVLLQRFQPFYLLFIALPFGQRFALANVIHPNMGNPLFSIAISFVPDVTELYHIFSLLGISICLAADIAILYYAISLYKKALIDAELWETKRVMELEQARYREIEERSEELAKIRHDFNNQLAAITQLARAGEGDSAQAMIGSLAREINGAEEPQ